MTAMAVRTPQFAPPGKAVLRGLAARAYRIPTVSPEADGTLEWNATTLIMVEIDAAGVKSMGYSYAGRGCIATIQDILLPVLRERNLLDIPDCWFAMCRSVRNIGRSGEAACAISAVDNALWDWKAKHLGVPLAVLLGQRRHSIPVYGSGGFTNYSPQQLIEQIGGWRELGIKNFKIKIGRRDLDDDARLMAAGDLQNGECLFVDANGAYSPKEALMMAKKITKWNAAWFEEPVSSDDIKGLQFVRQHAPDGMQIAAGEYAYTSDDFRMLLENDCVDSLQADMTRCQGLTGFLTAAQLAQAYRRPLSSHCAPALHLAPMCHAETGIHMEYFFDHARIEKMLFDGVPKVTNGNLAPSLDAPGLGLTFKKKDAEKYAV